jgi:hypothetical protein
MPTAYGYLRVSTDGPADRGLEARRQRLWAYYELKGLHLTEFYEDSSQAPNPRLMVVAHQKKRTRGNSSLETFSRRAIALGCPSSEAVDLYRPFW